MVTKSFHLQKIVLTLLVLLVSSVSTPATENRMIVVTVEEIDTNQGGNLILALFNSEGSWPKHDSALMRKVVPVSDSRMLVKFDQIDLDNTYAIQVIHDKNRNEKLDFRWFPYPKPIEGAGVSNNNRRIGPPSFEKALFLTDRPETKIQITLHY